MDRFLEESVSKHHRAAEEVLYYASWVVMIVSAILAFMYLNVMFYSFSISMLVMTLVFTGIAVYIFFFHDRLRTEYDDTFTNGSMEFAQVFNNRKRKALGSLEFAATAAMSDENHTVSLEMVQQVAQRTAMRYDKLGDDHYDIVSAYQKSMRGSDPDAALHYLARLLEAGDLPSACRRLMVCACEDVGLAWPQVIPIVKAAVDIANAVGLPEARLPLADAVILVATAPKSNSGHDAINAAMADVQAGRTGPIPRQLQNKHYDGEDAEVKGQHYKYAHSYPGHWVEQQYLPDALVGKKYYEFGDNKNEQAFKA